MISAFPAHGAAQLAIPARADTYQIVHVYPHDSQAFTQGLIYLEGHLYESTGLEGRSSLRMVDLATGRVLQKYDLPAEYFGEGLTDWGSNLIQLTWKAHKGFVYDRFSFSLVRTFPFPGEGWGLTHDALHLILSDGTPYLRFLNPKTFRETRRVRVTDEAGHPVENLNELEYVHGEIYANIWQTNEIVRISPQTGKVLGRIALSGIIDEQELEGSGAVLNGIAYDPAGDRLFVTGKLWPKLFEGPMWAGQYDFQEDVMDNMRASYQDIDTILKLYELRREATMRQARSYVGGKFAPKSAEEMIAIVSAGVPESGYVLQVYGYWDMVAAFVLDGPLHQQLVYDTCQEMYFQYAKIQPYLAEFRRLMNLPEWMRSLERLVEGSAEGQARLSAMRANLEKLYEARG
jgi:glutamine cyclotransferase